MPSANAAGNSLGVTSKTFEVPQDIDEPELDEPDIVVPDDLDDLFRGFQIKNQVSRHALPLSRP
jgi:hypothetical protein